MTQKVYTYVLHDKETDLYKIGKSTNPRARFRKLCRPGKVIPIHVFNEDIEGELHGRFNAQRLKSHPNPDYKDGHTEWFAKGGKLNPFIDSLEIQSIAFYSPHNLYDRLNEAGRLHITSNTISKKLQKMDFYQYIIGRKILLALGYIYYTGIGYDTIHRGIALKGSKIFLSDSVIIEILNKIDVSLVTYNTESMTNKLENQFGKELFMRKVSELEDGTTINMLIAIT